MMPTPDLTIDYDQPERFLEALVGPEWQTSEQIWQTFDDNKERRKSSQKGKSRNDKFARNWSDTWEKAKPKLTTYNLNGAGIYLTGNRCVGGRKIENLVGYRAVWLDYDNPDKPPPDDADWPCIPHIKVQTSPGKFQFWWRVSDLDSTSFWRLTHAMAHLFGGDVRATDAVHVMRLPGFYHQKAEPHLVELCYAEPYEIGSYTAQEMLDRFGVADWEEAQGRADREQQKIKDGKKDKKSHGSGPRIPIDSEKVRSALEHISADDRDMWLRMGMALASTGNPAAFELWDTWSQQSDKYDEDDQYRVWKSFREQRGDEHANPITLGTLFKTSRQAGWRPSVEDWKAKLLRNKAGELKDCPANQIMILSDHPHWKDRIRKNLLYGETEIDGIPIQDETLAEVAQWLALEMQLGVRSLSHTLAALQKVGNDHGYNPIQNFLDGLPAWDGTSRIDTLFPDFLGAEKSPYTAYVARVLLCGMVARAYTPGCIIRSVPILEGPEQIGKSHFVRDLGHPWSREVSTNVDSHVAVAEIIKGVWLAELMEMDAVSKAGAQRIKAFITTRNDRYRPAYGHVSIDHPRLAVFVGTINPSDAASQFREEDENTRFLPVVVSEYNADGFLSIREQLFAEAKAYLSAHTADWWLAPDDVRNKAAEVRAERTAQDPWIEKIEFFLSSPGREEVTIPEIMELLEIPPERWNRSTTTRAGILLTRLGWRIRRSDCRNGNRIRVYFRLPK